MRGSSVRAPSDHVTASREGSVSLESLTSPGSERATVGSDPELRGWLETAMLACSVARRAAARAVLEGSSLGAERAPEGPAVSVARSALEGLSPGAERATEEPAVARSASEGPSPGAERATEGPADSPGVDKAGNGPTSSVGALASRPGTP